MKSRPIESQMRPVAAGSRESCWITVDHGIERLIHKGVPDVSAGGRYAAVKNVVGDVGPSPKMERIKECRGFALRSLSWP